MKLLRIFIEEKKTSGQFLDISELNKGTALECCYKTIDLIKKEDLLLLMEYIIEHTDAEIDKFDNDALQNPAQNLIYKHLSENLEDVINRKSEIIKSVDKEFEPIEQKYKE